MLGDAAEAGSQVDRVPDQGEFHPVRGPQVAEDRLAGGDPDSQADFNFLAVSHFETLVQKLKPVLHAHGRAQHHLGRFSLVAVRPPEVGQDRVPDIFIDVPAVLGNDFLHGLEHFIEYLHRFLGLQHLRHMGKSTDVRKKDINPAEFPAQFGFEGLVGGLFRNTGPHVFFERLVGMLHFFQKTPVLGRAGLDQPVPVAGYGPRHVAGEPDEIKGDHLVFNENFLQIQGPLASGEPPDEKPPKQEKGGRAKTNVVNRDIIVDKLGRGHARSHA